MKLLLESTDSVDLDHAGYVSQLRFDDPILNGAEISRGVRLPVRFARIWRRFDSEQVDLAETGCDWSHRRLNPRRELVLDLLNPFVDQLSGEVDVSSILEDDSDLAQAVSGQRSGAVEMWKPPHRRLDRKRNTLLDFQRRVARCATVDLNLHVGDIRDSIDWQPGEIPGAKHSHGQNADHHQPTLADSEGKDSINHSVAPGAFPTMRAKWLTVVVNTTPSSFLPVQAAEAIRSHISSSNSDRHSRRSSRKR